MISNFKRLLPATLLALSLGATGASAQGGYSVQQVMQLLEQAQSSSPARQTISAYLSGIGEDTGSLLATAKERGMPLSGCNRSMNLSGQVVASALTAAVPDRAKWSNTPAAPIIVADLLDRAGCR